MKLSQFLIQLLGVTLFSIVLVFAWNINAQIASESSLSWATILIFVLFTGVVYCMSSYAIRDPSKNVYNSVILLVMMSRMLLSVLIIAIYVKTYEPSSNHFLIPFFSIYILYTIFEVHFMTRIGNYDGAKKNDG